MILFLYLRVFFIAVMRRCYSQRVVKEKNVYYCYFFIYNFFNRSLQTPATKKPRKSKIQLVNRNPNEV